MIYSKCNFRKFGEIYDLNQFTASLDEKVALEMDSQSAEISNGRITTVRVPYMVSNEFIKSKIEPIFKSTRSLRLSTYFPSSTMEHRRMNPYACLAMFDTLRLRPELQESIDSMIGTLRSLNPHSEQRFIAIDYRVETMLGSSSSHCHDDDATEIEHCFDAKELALFLNKIGFKNETTIYLTLNGWHTDVEDLRNAFPNTFTKVTFMIFSFL